ncbi:16S rRNA (uracil(1498)-N(3))-methyltransferase [Buchnera aphidicola str. APS (Acyrthosiphon pisum)]|uniref:Ribosomal RNA small subunit methyltransferase E n=2 Tax=Buchnera aphidicola TaxID=9 RepID=RSME_BUCAI|nr:16S rRNA (uracil(1498)-N(3))-methyltransferase [Buchnera aphidicola]P57488.1 RecName: Full=Ribosomal RNA small subunit methyltransferase E; AltName: Full=16S rRNA m3U1498 methyltransferase [Buchnera aphidicola str. APS (Acyrthosiphon pisum)]pir/G84977/ hypothetical protein [imported] - Buchnera sp. (strain APS) [Buchnera sp. (in: enterobacteria)]ADP66799.1 16S ribosomal RNA methyltransferase RsmE [Buchnera aphidicola str. TLW03 (Acyrthosiphon pisum)]ADP67892.1 16S ribosomal RNA methyltransfe
MFTSTAIKNKKIPRIYIEDDLDLNQFYFLSDENRHYVTKVLRMKIEDILEIFNNTHYIFFAKIIDISKKIIKIQTFKKILKNLESPLHIHLGQVISKNEKMDFTIQKSIEIGVKTITPLFFENDHFQKKRINFSNKIKRWEKIAISACRQCNRNIIPKIKIPMNVFHWCENNQNNDKKIIFHPKSTLTMKCLTEPIKYIQIIIGSERGFFNDEFQKIIKYGFIPIRLGPRILRTETASVVAITALQTMFGDFK